MGESEKTVDIDQIRVQAGPAARGAVCKKVDKGDNATKDEREEIQAEHYRIMT
jgi:hypothetical protein